MCIEHACYDYLMTVPQFRPRQGPGVAAGVTEAMIRLQVHSFYARVRQDPVLGPIFEARVADWDDHLARLCDFWSSVLLMTGRFKGQPMAVHARMAEIEPAHFARWVGLFAETAREVCPSEAADLFIAKAGMIADSLKLGVAVARGELPPLHAGIGTHRAS
jgi:hemoglobin